MAKRKQYSTEFKAKGRPGGDSSVRKHPDQNSTAASINPATPYGIVQREGTTSSRLTLALACRLLVDLAQPCPALERPLTMILLTVAWRRMIESNRPEAAIPERDEPNGSTEPSASVNLPLGR